MRASGHQYARQSRPCTYKIPPPTYGLAVTSTLDSPGTAGELIGTPTGTDWEHGQRRASERASEGKREGARVRGCDICTLRVGFRVREGLLPTTLHSIFYSRVDQIAIFSRCQPYKTGRILIEISLSLPIPRFRHRAQSG